MNKTLLRDRKRWRIKQIDKLDDGELDEQKFTQKIGFCRDRQKSDELANWRIRRVLLYLKKNGRHRTHNIFDNEAENKI